MRHVHRRYNVPNDGRGRIVATQSCLLLWFNRHGVVPTFVSQWRLPVNETHKRNSVRSMVRGGRFPVVQPSYQNWSLKSCRSLQTVRGRFGRTNQARITSVAKFVAQRWVTGTKTRTCAGRQWAGFLRLDERESPLRCRKTCSIVDSA